MNHHSMVKRYGMFLAGLLFAALGVSLITKANLGTSPVTSPSYVLSLVFRPSLGTFVLLVNSCLFVGEMLVLGKTFQKIQFLQIPATLIFSGCIDMWLKIMSEWTPQFYIVRIGLLLCGCVSLGFGISLEVVPDVLILPGEGMVRALAWRTKVDFGVVKTVFDITMVTCAFIMSIVFSGKILGVREGTIIAALCVGMVSRFFIGKIRLLEEKHQWIFVPVPDCVAESVDHQ